MEFSLLEKILSSPMEYVADPHIKTSAVRLVEFSCASVTKSLKAAEAGPALVLSRKADIYVEDNVA